MSSPRLQCHVGRRREERRRFFAALKMTLATVLLLPLLAAAPAVTVHKVDDTTVSGTLSALVDGKIILKNPDATVPLEDLIELDQKGAIAIGPLVKLTGRVIGTNGSFRGEPNATKDKAFDGNLDTHFDAPMNADNPWVGLDLGSPRLIRQIKYAPRSGRQMYLDRMVGGKFQGSDSADFTSGVTDLASVDSRPPAKKLTAVDITAEKPFRYVRYIGATPDSHCNVAEIEFWGVGTAGKRGSTTAPATTAAASQPITVAFGEEDRLTGRLGLWSDTTLRLDAVLETTSNVEFPLKGVREIWRGTPDQIAQAKTLSLDPGPEDAAFVLKGNAIVIVRGLALGVEGDALKFKFNDEERKIALSKLVGVILGSQLIKPDRSFHQSVRLAGEDSVSGKWSAYDAAKNTITVETSAGAQLEIPFSAVRKILCANGRLSYLSDMKPIAVEQVPYFDRVISYRIDKSLTGGPIRLADGEHKHGLSVHARCLLTYDLGGEYADFKGKVGFQQPEGKSGLASLRIIGDGKVLWENPTARGDAPKPTDLSLKISGVKQLILEADFGPQGDTAARIVWADARVLRLGK